MKIINIKISTPGVLEEIRDTNTSEIYISPTISVLTGHVFIKSNVLRVINLGHNKNLSDNTQEFDPVLEKKINEIGSSLLEKIIDENDLNRFIKDVSFLLNLQIP